MAAGERAASPPVIIEPDSRHVLACQYRIQSSLVVEIPLASRFFEQKILTESAACRDAVRPDVYKKYLSHRSAGGSAEPVFGVAVDIGTTTVVAKLIDMVSGQCKAVEAAVNPQTRYGDDVISRIAHAKTASGLSELHQLITDCINNLTSVLCRRASIDNSRIYEMCIVGNTAMNHIFLQLPVTQLGFAPYRAFSTEAVDLPAAKTAIRINPSGNIHTVENIAGFVGSDTVAMALAVGLDSAEQMSLAVDIGTNGEIVLGSAGQYYAASCAAGPAFEGARINCGSRAVDGAIENVVISDNDVILDVIGGTKARSICGSGLIDAVAVLLELGIIDSSGKFLEKQKLKDTLNPLILSRIIRHRGQPAFVLASNEPGGGKKVFLTQQDIRQMQLAKAAVQAGIKILQNRIGLKDMDIKHIFLAGAFGNYIRRESAMRIGLLPDVPLERIHFVGNAAGCGAQMMLISYGERKLAAVLAQKIKYIEIAEEKNFAEVFSDAIAFRNGR